MARSLMLMDLVTRELLKMGIKQEKESTLQKMALVMKVTSETTSFVVTERLELLMEPYTMVNSRTVSIMVMVISSRYKEEAQFSTMMVILMRESSMETVI